MAHAHPHAAPPSGGGLPIVPVLAAVAAVAAFFVVAREPSLDRYRAMRGPKPPPQATWLKVACAQPLPNGACPQTSTLRLGVEPSPGKRALAVALHDPNGLLVWSFPDEQGLSAPLTDEFVVVEVPLDTGSPPGVYKVFAIRTATAMTRQSARRWIEEALRGGAAAQNPDLVAARVVVAPGR